MDDETTEQLYPEIVGRDPETDDPTIHPIVEQIKNGHALTDVKCEDDWVDDHLVCLGVKATCNGQDYRFALLWVGTSGVKMVVKAECGVSSAIDELAAHILSEVEMFGEDC